MAVTLDNLPQLEEWVNLTEAAEILGITRQYAYKIAKRTSDGLPGGWTTIHQIGTKPHYVVKLDEVWARRHHVEAGGSLFGNFEFEEEEPEVFNPSPRLINAYSWWIAAELVRRHPRLMIFETHPGGGMYDCLTIRDGRDLKTAPPIADLNRAGSLHICEPGQGHGGRDIGLTWTECLSAPSPHLVVDDIAKIRGLERDAEQPPSPRALAYTFIAAALTVKMNSRSQWDARNEFLDSSGDDTGWSEDDDLRGYIKNFPSLTQRPSLEVEAPIEQTPRVGSWREPYDHYWAILRDEEPLLLVSIEGTVYTRHSAFQLSKLSIEVAGGMQALAAKLIDRARRERFGSL